MTLQLGSPLIYNQSISKGYKYVSYIIHLASMCYLIDMFREYVKFETLQTIPLAKKYRKTYMMSYICWINVAFMHNFTYGFSNVCPWAYAKHSNPWIWRILIGLPSLIMVDPPAFTSTTPIKTLQIHGFECLACAHGHTLHKPFYLITIIHNSLGAHVFTVSKKFTLRG